MPRHHHFHSRPHILEKKKKEKMWEKRNGPMAEKEAELRQETKEQKKDIADEGASVLLILAAP